jgi:hypothetical protein
MHLIAYLSPRFPHRAEIKPPSAIPAPITESRAAPLSEGELWKRMALWQILGFAGFDRFCFGKAKELAASSNNIEKIRPVLIIRSHRSLSLLLVRFRWNKLDEI